MTTQTAASDRHPVAPRAPSWGWALRRAVAGLVIMLTVTSLAAYLASASIDPVTAETEASPRPITIGTPAAAMLRAR
jgi:hypothetical protein